MNKLTIAVDLDSTLNNLNEVWIKRYNELYSDNLKQFDNWDVTLSVKPECGGKIFDILGEKNFFYNLGIREFAPIVMEYICRYYDVYIVTAYTASTCVDKVKWVEKYLPFFDKKKIVFCNDKHLFNADILIDDAPHNLEAFPNRTVCFDMPYNKNVICDYRAKDWKDILFIVNEEDDLINNK